MLAPEHGSVVTVADANDPDRHSDGKLAREAVDARADVDGVPRAGCLNGVQEGVVLGRHVPAAPHVIVERAPPPSAVGGHCAEQVCSGEERRRGNRVCDQRVPGAVGRPGKGVSR
eukprot:scaffold23306_cov125-Isochrysis_galbana.AAC.11